MTFGARREHFPVIDTTMRVAAARAEAGAPEGYVVSADAQTKGRGRLGRSWSSAPGEGLYFSLVLRPRTTPARAVPLTLACGLGVAEGLRESAGVEADIRWPNDVMLGEKKCAGILVEMSAEGHAIRHVIVGVGVNLNQNQFPLELEQIATSLSIKKGLRVDLTLTLEAVLSGMRRWYEIFSEEGPGPVIEEFSRVSSWAAGKWVRVEGGDREIRGVTAGLDADGVLLVRTPEGRIEPVIAGSVRPWQD